MSKDKSMEWLTLAREVLDIEIQGLVAVREQLDGGFLEALDKMACCDGRVIITGIGKSGLVGRKIAATLSSTGTPAFFLHPVEGAHGDMGMIREGDVALAISNSGETDELNALLPALKSLGAVVVAMTGNGDSTLARMADIHILVSVPREACPMGLAPTASTTAALAVGDALAVCLMQRRGFDQQDFQRFHPGGSLGQRLSLFVEDLMHVEGLPVENQDVPLAKALATLDAGGFGLLVLSHPDGRLAGVFSDGDVRRLAAKGGLDPARPVSEVMTPGPRAVCLGDSAALVLDIMEQHLITVLPVVDEAGMVRGLVHLHDVLGKGRLKFSTPFPGRA